MSCLNFGSSFETAVDKVFKKYHGYSIIIGEWKKGPNNKISLPIL